MSPKQSVNLAQAGWSKETQTLAYVSITTQIQIYFFQLVSTFTVTEVIFQAHSHLWYLLKCGFLGSETTVSYCSIEPYYSK